MIRVLSLFSGIGAFEKALTNLGVEYEVVNFCEIDPYAAVAYSAIHNVPLEKNLGDITKVTASQLPKDIDLITYGHPCQSFSLAGYQGGINDPRGDLMFEALRVINTVKPKVAVEENVLGLISKKFENEFNTLLNTLSDIGYNNYYHVYNAADYGIAQERKRVFTISVREDIPIPFTIPDTIPLTKSIYDYLEDSVSDKYYISDEKMKKLLASLLAKTGQEFEPAGRGGSQHYDLRKGIVLRHFGEWFRYFSDVSITLPARYHKGWGGFEMMGIAEIRKGDLHGNQITDNSTG